MGLLQATIVVIHAEIIFMNKATILAVVLIFLTACSADTDNDIDHCTDQSGLAFVHLNDTYRVGAVESGNAGGFGRAET